MRAAAMPAFTPSLRIEALQVTGARGRVLLTLDRLDLAPGTALGIRGPSGAGKSTLLMALAGLAPRMRGRVCWGGQDLAALPEPARAAFRAAHIGMIFQDFLLLEELDAAANAGIAALFAPARDRARLRARAAALLDRLGIGEGGAGRRAVALMSGGERQRVAVARALAHDPAIVLADEPTASLDRAAGDRLADALVALTRPAAGGRARTLVTVSHDPALLARMDRVLELRDGRLQA